MESLAKELRKKQKGLTENSSGNAFQRSRFLDLKKLLQAKLAQQQTSGGGGSEGKHAEEYGGANVMEVR